MSRQRAGHNSLACFCSKVLHWTVGKASTLHELCHCVVNGLRCKAYPSYTLAAPDMLSMI
jgi:hypothetical protein